MIKFQVWAGGGNRTHDLSREKRRSISFLRHREDNKRKENISALPLSYPRRKGEQAERVFYYPKVAIGVEPM